MYFDDKLSFWFIKSSSLLLLAKFNHFFVVLLLIIVWIISMMASIYIRISRCFLDGLMDITGLYYWTKRNQIPPITNPLLLKTATELAEKTRTGQVRFFFF